MFSNKKALLLFFFFNVYVVFAQHVTFTPTLKTVPNLIIEARFNEARKVLETSKKQDPKNFAITYLRGANLSIDLFIHADEERFTKELPLLEGYIESLEELPATEPWRNVFLGELKVALALLHTKFKSNLKGGWQFYQAYGLLEENVERFPDFTPTNMSFGVLQAALGSLPEDYRSIAAFFGLKGDLKVGMDMLNKAYWRSTASSDLNFLRSYYGFVYSFVHFQLYSETNISPESLNLPLTQASFLVYLQALLDVKDGKIQKAVSALQKLPTYKNEIPFYYLKYLTGKYALAFDPDLALQSFREFLNRPSNDAYKKSTYRFIAWYYILKNDKTQVEVYRKKVMNEGNTNLGADRQAQLEATEGFNYTLVKGRLYFDGAQYKKALSILEENGIDACCTTVANKVEWNYRRGRCYQSLGNINQAIEAFSSATAYPNATSAYGLANSYLQLGLLQMEKGTLAKAKANLKNVLRHKGFPFYEGLHQRAKAALAELEKT